MIFRDKQGVVVVVW